MPHNLYLHSSIVQTRAYERSEAGKRQGLRWAVTTRCFAIVPVVIVTAPYGEQTTSELLVLSQVILSMQLPMAVIPLVRFVTNPAMMGSLVVGRWLALVAWSI